MSIETLALNARWKNSDERKDALSGMSLSEQKRRKFV